MIQLFSEVYLENTRGWSRHSSRTYNEEIIGTHVWVGPSHVVQSTTRGTKYYLLLMFLRVESFICPSFAPGAKYPPKYARVQSDIEQNEFSPLSKAF